MQFSIPIDTSAGGEFLHVSTGSVTLVVGPNGVGKSALLQDLYRRLPTGLANYYPGHRQITFSHGWENLQMSLTDLDLNLFQQFDSFNRYKSVWPEEQFKSVLRRLQNAESAHNREVLQRLKDGEDQTTLLKLRDSPLELLNNIFQSARMPVRFTITDAGLLASRDDAEYQVDRLSDGERAALFIGAAVVNRRSGGVLIIDEPERHLHPSISAPLISAAVRSRPNVAFIFATHDLTLIETLQVDNFVYIRNSTLISERPEQRHYDVRHVSSLDTISPDLKRDILGVRDKVLFVEGERTSLDSPLYASCYEHWKVAPRGGHEKVQEAVRALQDNSELHWMHVAGIIDRDGRTPAEIAALRAKNIYALKVPTVENLFFLPEVVKEAAGVLVGAIGGNADDLINAADASLQSIIAGDRSEIIARRTAWLVNRKLSEAKVSVDGVRCGNASIPRINVAAIERRVERQIDHFLATKSNLAGVSKLPIKNTGIPAKIAQSLGLTLKRYKQLVLRQLEINSPAGQRMRSAILKKLPVLP